MTTYETVQSWLRGSASPFFAPLDAAGNAVAREGVDTVVYLFADPGPAEGDDPFFLYMPLLSLTGGGRGGATRFFLESLRAQRSRFSPHGIPAVRG
jgi:hypothetical protein